MFLDKIQKFKRCFCEKPFPGNSEIPKNNHLILLNEYNFELLTLFLRIPP